MTELCLLSYASDGVLHCTAYGAPSRAVQNQWAHSWAQLRLTAHEIHNAAVARKLLSV